MSRKQLAPNFYVSEQISVVDMTDIAAAGIKSIICNRPDGEAGDQPNMAEIEQAAATCGIEFHALPVSSGSISEQERANFSKILLAAPQPTLAYCRTGTRSTTLWSLHQAETGTDTEQVLQAAQGLATT